MSKLLCIDDTGISPKLTNQPIFGELYTLEFSRKEPNGKIGYVLKEIKNSYIYARLWGEMVEPSFKAERFMEWDEELVESRYGELEETI